MRKIHPRNDGSKHGQVLLASVPRRLVLNRGQLGLVTGVEASRMPEAAGAVARPAIGIRRDIIDDVVGTLGIAGDAADARQMIEVEIVAEPPADVVVGTGGVAAHPDSADVLPAFSVER